ncbi:hypothetical protein BASA50_007083 [Batrachochytrium salamandrivorans]|uniref:Uncharacterized protein n=1 Tax=Batrachochytrium salamandrivorans TaxID=1357716 RepID=A0ABQ8F823_9FUNG|nr:hypothetical protein BASA50_007083 [Batrachochytrium salamandrivorans]
MCTATPTDDSTRSAMGEFSSRIQKRGLPNRKKLTNGSDDDGYMDLKRQYEEANQDTHEKCTEYTTATFHQSNAVLMMNLEETGLVDFSPSKKLRDGTKYSQLSKIERKDAELEEKKKLEKLKGLRHLCEEAKTLEAGAKLKLRKYEKKNGYEKSQSYAKYQSKKTITRLEAEAKEISEA